MRLHDYLDYQARIRPETDFAVMGDRRMSYGEADSAVNRLANALVASGLDASDRVALLSKNSIEYVLLFYAASKAGVVTVPLNYRLAGPEWAYIINDSGAKTVFASRDYVGAINGIKDELDNETRCVVIGGEAEGWDGFENLVSGQPDSAPDRAIKDEHDVFQMYTSGTTGRPKGAVLTHGAVTANMEQITLEISGAPGKRDLIVAPLYHAAAAITAFSAVVWGGCLYIQEDFNPMEVVRALSEEEIFVATLVPAMIQACLVYVPDVDKRNYDNLRTIVYGASPIAEETLRKAVAVFGCDFIQAYGMTETTAVLTLLLADDHRRALESEPDLLLSAGRPLVGTEIKIVDEDDNVLPPNEIGEIAGRGPQLMRGYWNLPDESSYALRGGWMHTGDAGILDENGYVYVQDRVKDMIVSGGENVYPRVVEEVLFKHPAVADAAVFGIPHDQWGETVKAAIVLREGATATEEEIIEFCKDKLGGFERPRSVDFVAALPRNPTGKVLKRELREPYWAGHKRRVAGS
jgi:acyl-CoA synthetase (AMP-forming)/AMP-acid ligase II